tara:strand:- start:69 stop:413 length:345 start_codon:yes stop_codon:yes gene_type:complete
LHCRILSHFAVASVDRCVKLGQYAPILQILDADFYFHPAAEFGLLFRLNYSRSICRLQVKCLRHFQPQGGFRNSAREYSDNKTFGNTNMHLRTRGCTAKSLPMVGRLTELGVYY